MAAVVKTSMSQTGSQRVVLAALKLFASKGFQATGIREIAEGAGMSSAALYHYMGTKDDLLIGIMTHALSAWYATAAEAVEESSGPCEKLCNLIRVHVVCSGIFNLESTVVDTEVRSLSGKNRGQIVKLRDRYESLTDRILADGAEAGVFKVPDARILRLALLEMCNGVSRWYRPDGIRSIESIADEFANIGLAAARAVKRGRSVRVEDLATRPCEDLVKLAKHHFEAEL